MYNDNKAFREMLKEHCREGDIVVSHHLPCHLSIHPNYKGNVNNKWYLCNMERFILDRKPGFWFHGHTHEQFDYVIGGKVAFTTQAEQIGGTRIIANPRGYDGYEDLKKHKHGFAVEVSPRDGTDDGTNSSQEEECTQGNIDSEIPKESNGTAYEAEPPHGERGC